MSRTGGDYMNEENGRSRLLCKLMKAQDEISEKYRGDPPSSGILVMRQNVDRCTHVRGPED